MISDAPQCTLERREACSPFMFIDRNGRACAIKHSHLVREEQSSWNSRGLKLWLEPRMQTHRRVASVVPVAAGQRHVRHSKAYIA